MPRPLQPQKGDYIIEQVRDGFAVSRFDSLDYQTFPDEPAAVRYASEGAHILGYRLFRRMPDGYHALLR